MKKTKSFVAMLLATTLMAGSVVPAYAAVTYTWNSGTETYVNTDNLVRYENYPVWIWYHGYCYYYDGPYSYLKNCTTPDGYTVDEFGRWTENGVAVHNGFGHVKVGSDEYLGKSDDEIWSLMKSNLINGFENSLVGSDMYGRRWYTYGYGKDRVWNDLDTSVYGTGIAVQHNPLLNEDKSIMAWIGGYWSDIANDMTDPVMVAYYSNMPDVKEKTIKSIVGDNIGQELFDYIKQHADKTSSGYKTVLGADGQPIMGRYEWIEVESKNSADDVIEIGDEYGNIRYKANVFVEDPNGYSKKRVYMENVGDGICADTLDLTMWQNRKTDYGKLFSVEANGSGVIINVYK